MHKDDQPVPRTALIISRRVGEAIRFTPEDGDAWTLVVLNLDGRYVQFLRRTRHHDGQYFARRAGQFWHYEKITISFFSVGERATKMRIQAPRSTKIERIKEATTI